MSFTLFDRQTSNGKAIAIRSEDELEKHLAELRREKPIIVELVRDAGDKLTMGIGGPLSFVQFTGPSGEPPYLCAVGATNGDREDVEFLIGGTPTPIPRRLCLPFERALMIAKHFFRTGALTREVDWEGV